jgi:hypothetical protein
MGFVKEAVSTGALDIGTELETGMALNWRSPSLVESDAIRLSKRSTVK